MNRREFFKRNALFGSAIALGSSGLEGRESTDGATPPPESATMVPEYFGQLNGSVQGKMLRVGFAERDITPDIGLETPGDYTPSYITGFHDQCKVRAAVFDDGMMRVALVGTDSLIIPGQVVQAARAQIQERCGIPPVAVLVGAAHNHSAGPVANVQPGQYDHASAFVQHLAYDESPDANAGYLKRVIEQIVGAVWDANNNRVEAYCGVGTGIEDKVAFNRRLRMKNGLTYTHPGQGNPDIIGFAGPTDPRVGVVGAWDRAGRWLGCVVNFTCHATTNPAGKESSANWIYYMEKVIRGGMGAEAPVVFLQGAAGDITQVDNLSRYAEPQEREWAEFVGGRVGAEAVKVMLTMVPGGLGPLNAASKALHIRRRVPSPEHVREAYELVKKSPQAVGKTKWVFAKETVLLDYLVKEHPIVEAEVQAIQVGPAVFVSNPAELFCEYGLHLKAQSPFPETFVVSYANGAVGYVPTEEALGPHGGGYETRLTSYTNLEVTAGKQMVDAGLEIIGRMHPGKVLLPPKAPPFRPISAGIGSTPWSYGDVPPQLD